MKMESPNSSPSTDKEVLDMAMIYLSVLRHRLPTQRLKDCSAGASVLLFELSNFLLIHAEYHGNY